MWHRNYGRTPLGQRVNRAVRMQGGGNAAVIAAISDQVGVFYHELHFGPVNGEIFNHFMASLEAMVGDYPVVFIVDNAPIHNSMPKTYPTTQFKYLPPYSPFFNPIENTFSVLRNYFMRG